MTVTWHALGGDDDGALPLRLALRAGVHASAPTCTLYALAPKLRQMIQFISAAHVPNGINEYSIAHAEIDVDMAVNHDGPGSKLPPTGK